MLLTGGPGMASVKDIQLKLCGGQLLPVDDARRPIMENALRQEEEDKRVDQLSLWKNEPPLGGSR